MRAIQEIIIPDNINRLLLFDLFESAFRLRYAKSKPSVAPIIIAFTMIIPVPKPSVFMWSRTTFLRLIWVKFVHQVGFRYCVFGIYKALVCKAHPFLLVTSFYFQKYFAQSIPVSKIMIGSNYVSIPAICYNLLIGSVYLIWKICDENIPTINTVRIIASRASLLI
jgi:hypothetical protein